MNPTQKIEHDALAAAAWQATETRKCLGMQNAYGLDPVAAVKQTQGYQAACLAEAMAWQALERFQSKILRGSAA